MKQAGRGISPEMPGWAINQYIIAGSFMEAFEAGRQPDTSAFARAVQIVEDACFTQLMKHWKEFMRYLEPFLLSPDGQKLQPGDTMPRAALHQKLRLMKWICEREGIMAKPQDKPEDLRRDFKNLMAELHPDLYGGDADGPAP